MITEKVTVAEEAVTPGDKEDGKREHGEGMGHGRKIFFTISLHRLLDLC